MLRCCEAPGGILPCQSRMSLQAPLAGRIDNPKSRRSAACIHCSGLLGQLGAEGVGFASDWALAPTSVACARGDVDLEPGGVLIVLKIDLILGPCPGFLIGLEPGLRVGLRLFRGCGFGLGLCCWGVGLDLGLRVGLLLGVGFWTFFLVGLGVCLRVGLWVGFRGTLGVGLRAFCGAAAGEYAVPAPDR